MPWLTKPMRIDKNLEQFLQSKYSKLVNEKMRASTLTINGRTTRISYKQYVSIRFWNFKLIPSTKCIVWHAVSLWFSEVIVKYGRIELGLYCSLSVTFFVMRVFHISSGEVSVSGFTRLVFQSEELCSEKIFIPVLEMFNFVIFLNHKVFGKSRFPD